MDFSAALKELKAGKKIARAGWNGKRMWVKLVERDDWTLDRKHEPDVMGKIGLPWLMMKTANDEVVPWLASQTDILAEDWEVVSEQ